MPDVSDSFVEIDEQELLEEDEGEFQDEQIDPESASPAKHSLELSVCILCDAPLQSGKNICKRCGYRVGAPPFQEPQDVDLGKILSTTWRLFLQHYWSCLTVTFTDTLFTIVACVVSMMIGAMAAIMAGNQPGHIILFFLIGTGLGWSVAMSMFALGHIRYYLHLCRTERPEFSESMSFHGPAVGALLVGGAVYWSMFLLVFPSIFLWPFGRVVVDQNTSAARGLWSALRLTTKHSSVCLVLFVIKVGAFFVSGTVPILGILLLTPYFAILNTVAYLYFIGEFE